MKRRGKVVATAAVLSSIGLFVNGCAAAEETDDDGPQTITVWAWAEAADAIMEGAAADFEAENPNIKVEVVKMGAWDLQDKLYAAIASGGDVPDVAEVVRRVYPRFMASGQMLDLTDLASEYVDDFTEGSIQEVSHDGSIYAMPTETSYSTFAYNTSIFEEYGIDPESLKTWDDVVDAGAALEADGIKICTQSVPTQGAPGAMQWNMMLMSAGGALYDEAGAVVKNNAAAEDAFQWWYDIKDVCLQAASNSVDQWQAVKNRQVAGIIVDTAGLAALKSQVPEQAGEWRILPWPQFESAGEPTLGRWGGSAFSIPSGADHKDAAWKFVEYLTTSTSGIQHMWETGSLLTSNTAAWSNDFFHQPDPYFGDQVLIDQLEGFDLAPDYYWGYDWLQTQNILSVGIDQMFSGEKSPADAWASVEEQLANKAP